MAIELLAAGLLAMAAMLLFGRLILGSSKAKIYSDALSIGQSASTIIATAAAGYWFVAQGPFSPKISLSDNVHGFYIGDGKIIILGDLSITNAGLLPYDLRKSPYKLYIQQIVPIDEQVAGEFGLTDKNGSRLIIQKPNFYPAISKSNGVDYVGKVLAPSETKVLYFRTVIPCNRGAIIAFSSKLSYGPTENDFATAPLLWDRQTYVDLRGECGSIDNRARSQP
jgi:hypothetical protein